MFPVQNLLQSLPKNLDCEQQTLLWQTRGVRVERIVSQGHSSPPGFWYDQQEAEWVLLLQGAAGLLIEGQPELNLQPGDSVLLPARCRHRVTWTDPAGVTVWLAVFVAENDLPAS